MIRRLILASIGVFLILAVVLMAATGGGQQAQKIENPVTMQQPVSKAACLLNKGIGAAASFWGSYESGHGTYTYYDPAVECAASPTYPLEILSFNITLYDDGNDVWPAYFDVVVYDVSPTGGGSCDGPGAELCRISVVADQATFGYPTYGSIAFSTPCCVTGPFFMGVEYTSGQIGTIPSVLFDDNPAPVACDNWMRNTDATYTEWYTFWTQPGPGYPMFTIDTDTDSPNCGQPQDCDWQPGDPYKHHYPQLPDETGWAVNATQPMILAEDFMCMETGWIKDFHFWGAWKHEDEGTVIGFQLSLHADIPASFGCADTTWATGDCDGNGTVNVLDMIYLTNYVQGVGQPPNPLWIADMNGDCVIDQADVDLINDYLSYGPSVFDPYGGYPVPACCGEEIEIYSRPGETLWEFFVEDFDFTPVDPPTMEGWYDPATGEVIFDDHTAYWQYNICLPEQFWFWQDSSTIYWVNISAIVADPQSTTWGWKSTQDHWNDDAVWGYWGELDWIDIWEPSNDPITNLFWVGVDPSGAFMPPLSGGAGFYPGGIDGTGWFEYFQPEWEFWNIWFYDHPFDYDRKKTVHIDFDVDVIDPQMEGWLTFVINWSTDIWSLEGQPPGDSMPPIGRFDPQTELMFIGRDTLYDGPVFVGPHHYAFDWEYPNYNPEWVSIDVAGYNFVIYEGTGMITHDCIPSLDLSLVVTNGEETPQEGACCDTVGNCYITDGATCAANGHLYEGDGTVCTPNPCDTCDYQNPGDVNNDGVVNVLDVTYLVDFLYRGGPAPPVIANADLNGDCCIDWRDIQYMIFFIFMGGPPPVDCTCIYPPVCIDPPIPHIDGYVKHNLDGWKPMTGNPIGTNWHELYDTYCTDWTLVNWTDNGNGFLDSCDYVEFVDPTDPSDTSYEHIEQVTTTILVYNSTTSDTMYLDLLDPPNPLNDPVTNQFGSIWHEVYPDYCVKWQLVFPSTDLLGGAMDPGDIIFLQAISGPDSTFADEYTVLTIETDIVTTEDICCELRGDVALPKDLIVLVNDIVWLVDYLFKGGPPPNCLEEGDCAIPLDGIILVNDIVWLVDYLFKGGPPPPPC